MGYKKLLSFSLAATLATTLTFSKPKLSFNKILEENVAMAAPVTVAKEDQKSVEIDVKSCAKSLKSYIESGDVSNYKQFKELFSRYLNFAKSKDEGEKAKGSLFYELFFGKAAGQGEYNTQIRSGKSGEMEAEFKKAYPTGYNPVQFADAVFQVYSRCEKNETIPSEIEKGLGFGFVRLARERYYAIHPEKKPSAPPSSLIPVRIPVPSYVDDKTLDVFLDFFGLKEVFSEMSKTDKIKGLVASLVGPFDLKDVKQGSDVASALFHAYSSLGENDKKSFIGWLSGLEPNEKAILGARIVSMATAKATSLPYEVLKKEFDSWKEGRFSVAERIFKTENDLKRYPQFIRDAHLYNMAKSLEQKPYDETLENMELRLAYLRKKQDVLNLKRTASSKNELKQIDSELLSLSNWMAKFGITDTATTSTPEAKLSKLRAGLYALYVSYYTISNDNLVLAKLIEESSKISQPLYNLATRYIFELDRKTGSPLFKDVKPGDPDFAAKIRKSMQSVNWVQKVKAGRDKWVLDYKGLLPYPKSIAGSTPAELQSIQFASTLDPKAAAAFFDYDKLIKDNNLDSSPENRNREIIDQNGKKVTITELVDPEGTRKMVIGSVARLYQVSPLLVPMYFDAIRHIASICEDNRDAFRKAMFEISARIDLETDVLVSRVSPTQVLPMEIRKMANRLEHALSDLSKISKGSISQIDRFELSDQLLLFNQFAPFTIEQKPRRYAEPLLVNPDRVGGQSTPFPLPIYLMTPTPISSISGGSVTPDQNFGGNVNLPIFNPLNVYTAVGSVASSLDAYLYPSHPLVSVSKYLPGVNIPSMSASRLLNEIQRAFVPTQRADYVGRPYAGGGAAGIIGRKSAESWDIGGGGLASFITPTGGYTAGGISDSQRTFGGAAILAVPLFNIRDQSLESAVAGVEKLSSTTGNAWKVVSRAITTHWDPKNPKQFLVVYNQDTTENGKTYRSARTLLVEKDGTVYDLKGGQNDLVPILNYVAGYVNYPRLKTPATTAFNVEPTVERGGGALVFDIGKTPILLHSQAIPFFVADGKPQPLLVQETVGFATTVEKGKGSDKRTDIYSFALPWSQLKLKSGTDGSKVEDFRVYDSDFLFRRVKATNAWELTFGGGAAESPVGIKGKAGIFIKTQNPKSRFGGGSYYEAGASNLQALALLSDSDSSRAYVQSIHRIANTIYGSRETASRMTVGGLLHVVNQLKEEREAGVSYDTTFWRAVGVLSGLKSAARLDVSRISNLDVMLAEYGSMGAEIGRDPANAANLMNAFKSRYASAVRQVLDNYYLGIQVNKNWSFEASIVMKEEDNQWTKQVPDTIYSRTLVTWKSGFWRAFAAIPLLTPSTASTTLAGNQTLGLIGSGVGINLFDSVWLSRIAADAGAIVAMSESSSGSTKSMDWSKGFFGQGAASIFSNVLEDSNAYRKLVSEYDTYRDHIRNGTFSQLPAHIREKICRNLGSETFTPVTVEYIKSGKNLKLTQNQINILDDALWNEWFYDSKYSLEQKFNGHIRWLVGGSAYKFFGGDTYWDIGTFVEHVDLFKFYTILAKRSGFGLYAGAELTKGPVRAAMMGGADFSSGNIAGAASFGYRYVKGGIPMELGISGYGRSSQIPDYAAPFYNPVLRQSTPEFGTMIYFVIGGGGVPLLQPGTSPTLYTPQGMSR